MLTTTLIATVAIALPAPKITTERVTYDQGGAAMEGYLAFDASLSGKRPAILIVQDWDGITGHEEKTAEKLAALGYVAFCVDIYGKGVRPKSVAENSAQAGKFYKDSKLYHARLKAGLDILVNHSRVNAKKIGAIGYCFGGTGVLEMARQNMPVNGVVSFHGGLTPLAEVSWVPKPKILICHGSADTMVNDEVAPFREEMKRISANYKFISYKGAKHAFTVEGADKVGLPGVGYDKNAATKSWKDMNAFFVGIFGKSN